MFQEMGRIAPPSNDPKAKKGQKTFYGKKFSRAKKNPTQGKQMLKARKKFRQKKSLNLRRRRLPILKDAT